MATQICPNCNSDSFTWSIDEEESPLTNWGCFTCGYQAYEDESEESVCTQYKSKSLLRLKDDVRVYWWCCNCNISVAVKETEG